MNMETNLTLYRAMYRIRRFEETVLDNFSRGSFFGTTHTYLGQEANAVGVLVNMRENDIVFSNHRCHGHFLAYGGDPYLLFAELMGRVTGVCGGRGGSQHLHWRNFYSNGVLGGTIPIATGMALAEKYKQSGSIAIAFLGDGALGEGVIYESFNIAALWRAPILYVLENNHIAQTTSIKTAVAGDIRGRFSAFGIPSQQLNSSDVLDIMPVANELISRIRQELSPYALILDTHRFGPHSKGDDTRPADLITRLRQDFDPLQIHGQRLVETEKTSLEAEVDDEINIAFQKASNDPFPIYSNIKSKI
ncbi:MAG: thiamine pyrophosphate-dependent dehydrogenase E1 component subunit alpha [Anaerolineales bacterium]